MGLYHVDVACTLVVLDQVQDGVVYSLLVIFSQLHQGLNQFVDTDDIHSFSSSPGPSGGLAEVRS